MQDLQSLTTSVMEYLFDSVEEQSGGCAEIQCHWTHKYNTIKGKHTHFAKFELFELGEVKIHEIKCRSIRFISIYFSSHCCEQGEEREDVGLFTWLLCSVYLWRSRKV